MTAPSEPAVGAAPLPVVVLLGRCPRCGRGRLFKGLLGIQPVCPACGVNLAAQDAGDGPAVAGIFILGALTVIAAIIVDIRYEPPLWVHAVLWPIVVTPLAILLMRAAKALLIGLQWRHRGGALE